MIFAWVVSCNSLEPGDPTFICGVYFAYLGSIGMRQGLFVFFCLIVILPHWNGGFVYLFDFVCRVVFQKFHCSMVLRCLKMFWAQLCSQWLSRFFVGSVLLFCCDVALLGFLPVNITSLVGGSAAGQPFGVRLTTRSTLSRLGFSRNITRPPLGVPGSETEDLLKPKEHQEKERNIKHNFHRRTSAI